MPALSPSITAELADDVYMLTRLPTLEAAYNELNNKYGDLFAFSDSNLLKGKTGAATFIKSRTAFGFTLVGKGRYDRNAFMLFRGTQYLADWLTNFNISVSRSAGGQPVHDGFNVAFKSMRPKLTEFMNSLPKDKRVTVHCIGHSLGGALATVCADWIVSSYGVHPYVYTFGSPRVGLLGFADACTKRVGGKNIFRAYHRTDMVPFMPIWPFFHTPYRSQDYYLPSPGNYPAVEYHKMVHYIQSVAGKSWGAIGGLKTPMRTDEGIAKWLKEQTATGMTITTIEWLNQALVYVLRKCVEASGWIISGTYANSFTLMDTLAYILSRGVKLAENVSSLVVHLIHKIMRILGYGRVVEAADMTRGFIKAMLMELQQRLNQYVRDALSRVLVEGRAI